MQQYKEAIARLEEQNESSEAQIKSIKSQLSQSDTQSQHSIASEPINGLITQKDRDELLKQLKSKTKRGDELES